MLRVRVARRPAGVPLIFFDAAPGRTVDQAEEILVRAYALLASHSPEWAGTVSKRVRFIVARNTTASYTLPEVGGLVLRFTDGEVAKPELMAGIFVQAAAYLEELDHYGSRCSEGQKLEAAQRAAVRQREFLVGLPDGTKYLEWLAPRTFGTFPPS